MLAVACAVIGLPLMQGGSAVASPERARPVHLEFRGESTLAAGLVFETTVVGGLSSIAYDAGRDVYYAISDDQGSLGPVRVYTLTIDVTDGELEPGDVAVLDVTALEPPAGETYAPGTVDPEGPDPDRRRHVGDHLRRCAQRWRGPLDPGVPPGRQLRARPHRAGAVPGGSRHRRAPEPRLRGSRRGQRALPVHRQRGRPRAGRTGGNADGRLCRPAPALPPRVGAGRPHLRLSGRPRRGRARAAQRLQRQRPGGAATAEQPVPARDGALVLGRRGQLRDVEPGGPAWRRRRLRSRQPRRCRRRVR